MIAYVFLGSIRTLLQIEEVAELIAAGTDFKLLEVMSLPASFTKGANATGPSNRTYERRSLTFDINAFEKTVRQIEKLAKAGATINPEDFYPAPKELSIVDLMNWRFHPHDRAFPRWVI